VAVGTTGPGAEGPGSGGSPWLPPAAVEPHAHLEDQALVALIRDGDGGALESLYTRYSRPCTALARRLLGDGVLAQDVVQEVFLALWRAPERFDATRGGFASWLLAITHHKAVDSVRREENLRKRRTSADALDDRESDAPQVYDEVWAALRRDRVRAALQTLPPVQREALALAYFGGYTQREIAGLTSTPLGTVKTRMLAGMRRLRDALDGVVTTEPSASPRRPGASA
jgi:RNA polymerase sigma factor (sigma-70 family)